MSGATARPPGHRLQQLPRGRFAAPAVAEPPNRTTAPSSFSDTSGSTPCYLSSRCPLLRYCATPVAAAVPLPPRRHRTLSLMLFLLRRRFYFSLPKCRESSQFRRLPKEANIQTEMIFFRMAEGESGAEQERHPPPVCRLHRYRKRHIQTENVCRGMNATLR